MNQYYDIWSRPNYFVVGQQQKKMQKTMSKFYEAENNVKNV